MAQLFSLGHLATLMPIKDTFKYAARWDSVGLDCCYCQHFREPAQWPDTAHVSRCELHGVSLVIELGSNDYKNWEWFCKDFKDNGRGFPPSVAHFQAISQQLEPGVLYRFYGEDGNLVEHKMAELEKI